MILDAVQTQSAPYRCPVSSWGVMVTFLICLLLTASDEQGTLNPPADGLAGVTAAPEADDGDAAAACRQQFLIIVQSPGLSAVEAGRQYNLQHQPVCPKASLLAWESSPHSRCCSGCPTCLGWRGLALAAISASKPARCRSATLCQAWSGCRSTASVCRNNSLLSSALPTGTRRLLTYVLVCIARHVRRNERSTEKQHKPTGAMCVCLSLPRQLPDAAPSTSPSVQLPRFAKTAARQRGCFWAAAPFYHIGVVPTAADFAVCGCQGDVQHVD